MIRIATKDLVNILTDLIATTCPDDGAYPELAAVLMFTDRGYAQADEPGQSDVLAGVSTNRRVAGHAFVPADGQMTPVLWPVSKAVSVIGMFKPKLKGNKEHGVIITRAGEHVIVQEDPNLFDDGDRFEFKSSELLDKFPRVLTELIEEMPSRLLLDALISERGMKAKPRTDFYPADLALLCKIATRRNALIETYRTDQDARILVQIGPYWRGWIRPVPYETDKQKVGQAAYEPSGEVFHPDLPETDVEQPALDEDTPPPPPAEPTLPLETTDEPDKEAEPVP